MRIKYDQNENAVWIELAKGTYKRTRKISDVILVDEDPQGKILGIEILDATKTIEAFDPQTTTLSIQTTPSHKT